MKATAEQRARQKAISAATKPLKEQIDRLWALILIIHPEVDRSDIFEFRRGKIYSETINK